jgi:hypothetical protein
MHWLIPIGILTAATTGVTAITIARTPQRDMAYFAAHPAERHATLKWCAADTRHAESPDCSNAFRSQMLPNVVK